MRISEPPQRPSIAARQAVSELIALQRRIFRKQRQLIESREAHQTRGFARYRNEFHRAVSGYIAESGLGALSDSIAGARVAFVADYHTLRLAQKTFVTLIKAVLHQVDNLCLAVEFVHEDHQRELDRFLEGKIKERTFLSRIRYKEQWPYDIWPNFKPIFDLAAANGLPMVAIDTDSSLPLPERDRRAAARLAQAALDCPDATIMVYGGQMHMAPSHLPAKVDLAFIKRGLPAPERVIVYQNAEEIYWQLAREGREEIDVVQVAEDAYCVNNTPPLVQQLSYIHWIHYDEELLEYTELERTVRTLIIDLARYLGLPAKPAKAAAAAVRVLMPADLDLMEVLDNGGLDEAQQQQVLLQVEAEESACIPTLETIYMATLSVNHAAEEAAHYLKHTFAQGEPPEHPRDLFYFLVLNEACAFFGSKVINPKRKADHAGRLRATIARSRKQKKRLDAGDRGARFVLEHLSWERGKQPRKAKLESAKLLTDPAVFNAAVHQLGYVLGDRLYYALTDGVITKAVIRKLYLARLDGEREAFETYMALAAKVRGVKIPRRI